MKQQFKLYRNGKYIMTTTLPALYKRTKNLACGGRVKDMIEAGYILKEVK